MKAFNLTLGIVMTIAALPAMADTEIALGNSGFERLSPDGAVLEWRVDTEMSHGRGRLRGTTEVARTGAGSLEVVHNDFASTTIQSDPVELQVGHLYRLSGWIRTDGAVSDPTAKYPTAMPACLTMASFPFTNHSPTVGATSDWTRVESLFIATSSADRVRLHLGFNGGSS
jgi:hypothetical protein